MKIFNCNEEKLKGQKDYLFNEVINGENNTYFKIIDLECGTGKTVETQKALAHMALNTDKKALFVRERNTDCIESAKIINKMARHKIAIAINSDTITSKEFNKIKETIKNYPIVIITHEKYKVLSINNSNRKWFTENRNILIIDEFLNMSKGNDLSISKMFIESFETLLQYRTLREMYAECIIEIEDYLMSDKKHHSFFNAKNDFKSISTKINKLKTMVSKTLTIDYLKSIGYSKKSMCDKIDELKQFYNQTCVVEGGIIYCTDKRYQYWLLDNNIILDASAKIQSAYKLNTELFHIQHQTQVLDHVKWSFFIVQSNSCKSAKDRALNFYETVNRIVEKQGDDNTLVIGNKNDEQYINAKYKNHFGNLTGSNEYRDLSNVVIAHNPNINYRVYVLEYIYFSNKTFDNRNSWEGCVCGSGDSRVYRFHEEKFEEYRQGKNSNEIYQAIKRINRNMEKDSKVSIFNNDAQTIDKVMTMFKGVKDKVEIENIIEYEKNKMDKYNKDRIENRQAMKFISLCKEIMELKHIDLQATKKNRKGEYIEIRGNYKKSDLREFMEIKSKSQFSQKILNDIDVIDFLKRHNIDSIGQSLDFSGSHIL